IRRWCHAGWSNAIQQIFRQTGWPGRDSGVLKYKYWGNQAPVNFLKGYFIQEIDRIFYNKLFRDAWQSASFFNCKHLQYLSCITEKSVIKNRDY
ncbi:MAG: hypothetical protein K2P25_14575, partial [Lachnospiraceae bacterium]|nr:hypothetical protein [Lachnospiraceae bacterium]